MSPILSYGDFSHNRRTRLRICHPDPSRRWCVTLPAPLVFPQVAFAYPPPVLPRDGAREMTESKEERWLVIYQSVDLSFSFEFADQLHLGRLPLAPLVSHGEEF